MNAPRFTASLTIAEWQTVLAHLRCGQYEAVADTVASIASQIAPQIDLAQMAAEIKGERAAFQTLTTAESATIATEPVATDKTDIDVVH